MEGFKLSPAEYEFWADEAERLTALGVIVELGSCPAVCCPAFFVPKGNKFRLVADFRGLNAVTQDRLPCSLAPLLPWLEQNVAPGAQVQVCDVSDAFYCIKLSAAASRLCNFVVGTGGRRRYFRYLALPMGLSSSPGALTLLFRTTDRYMSGRGVPTQSYLDDFISAPPAGREGELEALLISLGLKIKPSSRQLGTDIVYLGHRLQTESTTLTLTAERRRTLFEMTKRWFACLSERRGCVPLRWVESGVARLVFASIALPLLRLDLLALYRDARTLKIRLRNLNFECMLYCYTLYLVRPIAAGKKRGPVESQRRRFRRSHDAHVEERLTRRVFSLCALVLAAFLVRSGEQHCKGGESSPRGLVVPDFLC